MLRERPRERERQRERELWIMLLGEKRVMRRTV